MIECPKETLVVGQLGASDLVASTRFGLHRVMPSLSHIVDPAEAGCSKEGMLLKGAFLLNSSAPEMTAFLQIVLGVFSGSIHGHCNHYMARVSFLVLALQIFGTAHGILGAERPMALTRFFVIHCPSVDEWLVSHKAPAHGMPCDLMVMRQVIRSPGWRPL